MGIKGLFDFLRKNTSSNIFVKATELSGAKIAIDLNGVSYSSYSVCYSIEVGRCDRNEEPNRERIFDDWSLKIVNMMAGLVSYGMKPIIVIDGKHSEIKRGEVEKRMKSHEKCKEKMEKYEEEMMSLDILDQVSDKNSAELRRLKSQMGKPLKKDFSRLSKILRNLGFPVLQAKYDGEALCCLLVHCKKAHVVYSPDSDCLAYGIPLLITGPDKTKVGGKHFSAYKYDAILNDLSLSKKQFTDMCIASGCDYNENIKGVAIRTVFKYMAEGNRFDEDLVINSLSRRSKDISPLNMKECREIFGCEEYGSLLNNDEFEHAIDSDDVENLQFKFYEKEVLGDSSICNEDKYKRFSAVMKRSRNDSPSIFCLDNICRIQEDLGAPCEKKEEIKTNLPKFDKGDDLMNLLMQ